MASFDNTMNQDEQLTNSPMITNSKLEIGDEFLKILQINTFNGMDGGDVVDHISKVLKITKWIKIPNVEINELRLHVFSKSLSGDAQTWWNNEINETTITWKELNDKFFHKYYPLSYTCNSKILDDLDHGTDYFEFIYWLASKFDNYWEIDRNTKNGLWKFYVNERTNRRIGDLDECKEPCKKDMF
ncbi:reverse transcriptase domain-containing protein [Tanacetum coccineum]